MTQGSLIQERRSPAHPTTLTSCTGGHTTVAKGGRWFIWEKTDVQHSLTNQFTSQPQWCTLQRKDLVTSPNKVPPISQMPFLSARLVIAHYSQGQIPLQAMSEVFCHHNQFSVWNPKQQAPPDSGEQLLTQNIFLYLPSAQALSEPEHTPGPQFIPACS